MTKYFTSDTHFTHPFVAALRGYAKTGFTSDAVLHSCGLVNAYQLGWMDGAGRCADEAALKRVRRALKRYPWLTKEQRRDIALTAVGAAYGMAWEEDDDE